MVFSAYKKDEYIFEKLFKRIKVDKQMSNCLGSGSQPGKCVSIWRHYWLPQL